MEKMHKEWIWPYFVVAVLAWAPAVALIALYAIWPSPRQTVPSHWSFMGEADSFQSSTALFWSSLLPALLCALICTLLAVFFDRDVGKWAAALGLSVFSFFGAGTALQWPIAQATAATPGGNEVSQYFYWYLAAFLFGVMNFLIAATRTNKTPPTSEAQGTEQS